MKSRNNFAILLACFFLLGACAPGVVAQDEPPKDAPAPKPAGEDEGKPDDATDEGLAGDKEDLLDEDEVDKGFREIELLARAMEIIRQNYVDDDKVAYERLVNAALEGMLSSLDPHSQFLHPDVFRQLKENEGETYEGVGITVAMKNEDLTVVSVREDGPAAGAGVLPKDQILKINDILTQKMGLTEAINLLKGKPGEKLVLTLRRPATKETLRLEMIRGELAKGTVRDAMLLDSKLLDGDEKTKIGYVRLLQFGRDTSSKLKEALDQLEDDHQIQGLVLDLRNNPGGLLTAAVDVCGEFVPPGTLVVTTEGRVPSQNTSRYRTKKEEKERKREYPVAVLINGGSASASELVSACLQDLKRGIVVGEQSFGKGSVQVVLPMGNGTAMRLTTAKYYTPGKRTIHEIGVKPDIVSALTPSEEKTLHQWFNRAKLGEVARKRAGLDVFVDRQLKRAAQALQTVISE